MNVAVARRDHELARRATDLGEWFRQTTPIRGFRGSFDAERYGKDSHRPCRRHPAHVHLRLPSAIRTAQLGQAGPGSLEHRMASRHRVFSGLPHRLSRRRSRVLQSSARPSTRPGVTRSRSVRPTPACTASSRTRALVLRAETSRSFFWGDAGFNVATTTLTKRQSTSSRSGRCSEDNA
jgi:hypothetical protein